ncbi:MAG TPA: IclR family transcriptional regulator [Paracoccaceae bacterium]|nr:IclR family transcriptional regulator [Paracoccaceae bacterium]
MGTVSKALDLLDLFSRAQPLIGLSDLSRQARVNKATCYRLMSELQSYGLVEQIGSGREYRLGPALLRLAALREAAVPTRDATLPLLQTLARNTGETAHLSQIVAGELRTVSYAYSPAHAMKVMMEDADILPLHATSSGLAVLAHLPSETIQAILSGPLAAVTEKTMTDAASIHRALDQIRATGVAESAGGFEPDVDSLAVPLFDAFGQVSGALAVAAPAARMSADLTLKVRRALTEAAAETTRLLGGAVPPELAQKWQAPA